jgi:transcriptional regulator GlxA family with amidase domain
MHTSGMSGRNDKQSAFSATRARPRRIVLIAFDGVEPVDISGPSSVFGRAAFMAPGSYDVIHASPHGGKVTSAAGLTLADLVPVAKLPRNLDTILVAGGTEAALRAAIYEDGLGDWLARRARTTRRIGGVCTGAFILAASGLLDGKRAVTHWASCDLLAQLSPQTQVEADALYVIDGQVCTSAGVTAGIDLALALVEQDLGRDIAARIAREMVLFLRRPGGQSQYSEALAAQTQATGAIGDLVAWITDHPAADLGAPSLARRAGMSERTFARAFTRETGSTPAAFVRKLRLETARRWLETTSWPVKRIAQRSGFGSEDSLARAMRTALNTTPAALRARFGA